MVAQTTQLLTEQKIAQQLFTYLEF